MKVLPPQSFNSERLDCLDMQFYAIFANLMKNLNAILPPSESSNLTSEFLVELILYGNERLRLHVNR